MLCAFAYIKWADKCFCQKKTRTTCLHMPKSNLQNQSHEFPFVNINILFSNKIAIFSIRFVSIPIWNFQMTFVTHNISNISRKLKNSSKPLKAILVLCSTSIPTFHSQIVSSNFLVVVVGLHFFFRFSLILSRKMMRVDCIHARTHTNTHILNDIVKAICASRPMYGNHVRFRIFEPTKWEWMYILWIKFWCGCYEIDKNEILIEATACCLTVWLMLLLLLLF